MTNVITHGGLTVARDLYNLVNDEILANSAISAEQFWSGLDKAAHKLAPKNLDLLQKRTKLQKQIDEWLQANSGGGIDANAYEAFLSDIGYLHDDAGDFNIETSNVDPEIATIAGPQLVVPITNARYALNAANARWGSLYDALYGTDVISDEGGLAKHPAIIHSWCQGYCLHAQLLDQSMPLAAASWTEVSSFAITDGALDVKTSRTITSLLDASQFVGYTGTADLPNSIIMKKNGLHLEIIIDANGTIGVVMPPISMM